MSRHDSGPAHKQVIDVTVRLIGADGVKALSSARVAQEAGLNPDVVDELFVDRREWFLAAMDHLLNVRRDQYRSALGSVAHGERSLTKLIAAIWEFFPGPTWVAWLELFLELRGAAGAGERIVEMTSDFDRDIGEMLRSYLSGLPADEVRLASVAMVALDGLALTALVTRGVIDTDEVFARLLAVLEGATTR